MASYNKYVMMGVTTILLPLGKMVFKKIMNKFDKAAEQDWDDEASNGFAPIHRLADRGKPWQI